MTNATAILTADQIIAAAKIVETEIVDALRGIDLYPLRGDAKYNLVESVTGVSDRVAADQIILESLVRMIESGEFRFVRSGDEIVGITDAN